MKSIIKKLKLPFAGENTSELVDPRSATLELSVPKPVGKGKTLELNPKTLQDQYASGRNDRNVILREMLQYLDSVNKTEIKPAVRLQLNETVTAICTPYLNEAYRRYVNQNHSFPEDAERKTLLGDSTQILRSLVTSWKILLLEDYQQGIKKFIAARARIEHSILRIMELSNWQLRLAALRYQKLSFQEWKDLNQAFFIELDLFDPNRIHTVEEHVGFYKIACGFADTASKKTTILNLYVLLQLYGLLDVTSWPGNVIQAVDQYLCNHLDMVVPLGKVASPGNDKCIYMTRDQAYPPRFSWPDTKLGAVYAIDVLKLHQRVQSDIEEIRKKQLIGTGADEEKKRLQPGTRQAALKENQSMLELFAKNLQAQERKEQRNSFYGSKYLNLYTGLASSYRLLHDMVGGNSAESLEQKHFRDAVAQHSSLLIDGDTQALECRWQVLNESTGGLLLKTTETKYMHPMEVGQLVAIVPEQNQPDNLLQIGFITRLHRSREGEVEVALVKLSTSSDAAMLLEPGQENLRDALPGILIRNLEGGWQIVVPRQSKYVSGSPVMVRKNRENYLVRFGQVILTRPGFSLFEIRSPHLK